MSHSSQYGVEPVMADPNNPGALANAARTLGTTLGKAVSTVSGLGSRETAPQPSKENAWHADYQGSGTFIIHKPKRSKRKQRQSVVRNRRPGIR